MINETNHFRDSVSVLEERKLLKHMVSLGVGYPYGNSLGFSKAAISNADMLHRHVSRTQSSQKCSDAGSIIRDAQDRIRNGNDGYYLLDLHKSRIFARGQHPIADIVIDFILSGANDRVLLRGRTGARLHDTRFLVVPDAVYFLGMNGTCVPLKEFHALSFIRSDDDSKTGFVVDYDTAQNNRPLVLFPCEENSDIIQGQLDHDDRCWTAECESFIGNIGSGWKNI